MKKDLIRLHDGAILARRIGRIVRCGIEIDIVRPGYDVQGERRSSWTQFCVKGVPVYTDRYNSRLPEVMARFDAKWREYVGDDEDLARRAVEAARQERLWCFMDGITGVDVSRTTPITYIS